MAAQKYLRELKPGQVATMISGIKILVGSVGMGAKLAVAADSDNSAQWGTEARSEPIPLHFHKPDEQSEQV